MYSRCHTGRLEKNNCLVQIIHSNIYIYMYKYIFTRTFDLEFVSVEPQQKWYRCDNDADTENLKTTAVTLAGDLSLRRTEIL